MTTPTSEQSSREQEIRERATKMAHAGWTDVGISVNSLQMILRELLDIRRPTLSGQTAESGEAVRFLQEVVMGNYKPQQIAAAAQKVLERVIPLSTPSALPAQAVGEWLPIETAPKGRHHHIMLAYAPDEIHLGGFVSQGYWLEMDEDAPDNMGHDGGFVDVHFDFFKCARSFGNPSYQSKGLQPTHWQPLPAAPGSAPQEASKPEQQSAGEYWAREVNLKRLRDKDLGAEQGFEYYCGDAVNRALAHASKEASKAEPVAWANPVILLPADEGDQDEEWTAKVQSHKDETFSLPLYTHPSPQALSDEGGKP